MDNPQIEQNNIQPLSQKKISFGRILLTAALILILLAAIAAFASKPKTGSATLSWDANTETDFAGYKIYYGTASRNADCPPGGYADKIDTGKTESPASPQYTLQNLESGKTYYFSITSYDAAGNESCFSPEMNKNMPSIGLKEKILKFWK